MGTVAMRTGMRVVVSRHTEGGSVSAESAIAQVTPDNIVVTRPEMEFFPPLRAGDDLTVVASCDGRLVCFPSSVLYVGDLALFLRRPAAAEVVETADRSAPRIRVDVSAAYARVECDLLDTEDKSIADHQSDIPWQPCLLEDISESGVLIRTHEHIRLGEPLIVAFELPSHGEFKLLGAVVRSLVGFEPGYGLRFTEVHDEDRRRIGTYIANR